MNVVSFPRAAAISRAGKDLARISSAALGLPINRNASASTEREEEEPGGRGAEEEVPEDSRKARKPSIGEP
jgi:hypothetical protein